MLCFNSRLAVLGPRSLDPRWIFSDLTHLGDREMRGHLSGYFPSKSPSLIQAFPLIGWPVMPSRRQLGGRSSVRRWLEAVEVSSGSQSFNLPGLGEHWKHSIILPYVPVCMIWAHGPFIWGCCGSIIPLCSSMIPLCDPISLSIRFL